MSERDYLETSVAHQEEGVLLIDWLCNRFKYLNRDQWREQISEHQIRINGHIAGEHELLHSGYRVRFSLRDFKEPEVNRDYKIIHRCTDYVVVNKPADLPSHPGGAYRNNSLWSLLKTEFEQPALMNRLDRETSGLVLVSLTERGRKLLDAQVGSAQVEKDYLLVVHGEVDSDFRADGWLSHDPNSEIRKKRRFTESFPDGAKAQSCSTAFHAIATDGQFSLLRARLETGRTHQIRASVLGCGYPLVGDKIYGLDELWFLRFASDTLSDTDRQRMILSRQALHAAKLELNIQGKRECFFAPLPDDFAHFVQERFHISLSHQDEVKSLWE